MTNKEWCKLMEHRVRALEDGRFRHIKHILILQISLIGTWVYLIYRLR